ncbi:hypothetical protein HOF92_03105 [bacterium]|jgi:formylmethanofuran dehydrogenase subunit E|nr:hypothetical protein [bacterium]
MTGSSDEQREQTLQESIELITAFHGKYAPGAVIGAYMVDLAQEHLQPLQGKLNAVAESTVCLADSIQVMTGCTIGNKYLWLMNYGRYALCLYDRTTKEGIRVFVNYNKIDAERTPILKKFFDGTRNYENTPRPQQQKIVIDEFLSVKREILGFERVYVRLPEKGPLPEPARCLECDEYFKTFEKETVCRCCARDQLYSREPGSEIL